MIVTLKHYFRKPFPADALWVPIVGLIAGLCLSDSPRFPHLIWNAVGGFLVGLLIVLIVWISDSRAGNGSPAGKYRT